MAKSWAELLASSPDEDTRSFVLACARQYRAEHSATARHAIAAGPCPKTPLAAPLPYRYATLLHLPAHCCACPVSLQVSSWRAETCVASRWATLGKPVLLDEDVCLAPAPPPAAAALGAAAAAAGGSGGSAVTSPGGVTRAAAAVTGGMLPAEHLELLRAVTALTTHPIRDVRCEP
jgi:hypothetical protein